MPNTIISIARQELSASPQEVYPEMLSAIQEGNWLKFENGVRLLLSLIQETDTMGHLNLRVRFQKAIQQKNRQEAEKSTVQLILQSAIQLLKISEDLKTEDKKKCIRQAFSEVLVLQPMFKEIAGTIGTFQKVLDTVQQEPTYQQHLQSLIQNLRKLAA